MSKLWLGMLLITMTVNRFPFKKNLQHLRDVSTLPKAIVKCGTEMYKLPPLTAVSCIITSGSFILDFNIQGIRFRHYDYFLINKKLRACKNASVQVFEEVQSSRETSPDPYSDDGSDSIFDSFGAEAELNIKINNNPRNQGMKYSLLPNGHTYYTKERQSPLICDHHVCEWNNTNFYGGPFIIPGDPGTGLSPIPPFIDATTEAYQTTTPSGNGPFNNPNMTYSLDGCWFMFPPNYGSIAGISYLDPLTVNEYRFTCQGTGNKGLYWYPQWMGTPPHHPYPQSGDIPTGGVPSEPYYPHQAHAAPKPIVPSALP
ncbi:hypothetical protein MSG28_013722 [Choristoneura fumiferana]|uniref:Uncharacterized protein n=1 Tax=Choristoneura fumiferana TaxID=7141 RepID=A0ACC0K8M0_CHOFU|nr:hypothetical protein MSG28_013722 [Choristoneura fumiferana]